MTPSIAPALPYAAEPPDLDLSVSVFTPIHRRDLDALFRAYCSLAAQDYVVHEWIIVPNGDAVDWLLGPNDLHRLFAIAHRNVPDAHFYIRIMPAPELTGNIGALKKHACEHAVGDILLELDYDDTLEPSAVLEVVDRFTLLPQVQFVYSDSIEVLPDGSLLNYGAAYGWQYGEAPLPYEGRSNAAFPATPQYLRRIEWAPNHLRAFRAEAYFEIGGHDPNLSVGDDHDLVCRFFLRYGEAGFFHIAEALYVYHRHAHNTCTGPRNAEIQAVVDRNYCQHTEAMFLRWANDRGLACLDLGGGLNTALGYRSVDIRPTADIVQDLNEPWDFSDDSVGVIRAYHILEHLHDPIHFFNECYRVLAPGGLLLLEVPSTDGPGAFADPTHKKFFNLLSFEYYTNQRYAQYIQPQYQGRFQKARVVQYWWDDPNIPVVSAQLIALKGWYNDRWCGLKEI